MEQLLDIARRHADRVEVMFVDSASDGVSFEDAKLKDIESSRSSGVCLTIIKDGKLGFAYTSNLVNPERLVRDALASLKGEVAADYDLPLTKQVPELDTYDAGIEKSSTTDLVEECQRICDSLAPKTKGQVNCSARRGTGSYRLLNSAGTDLSAKVSQYWASTAVFFPGSYSSIHRAVVAKSLVPAPDSYLDFILNTYNSAKQELKRPSGKTRVLFLPEALYALVWRLTAAAGAKPVYEKVSPLKDRVGEQVFSDMLTFANEPLNDRFPGARSFDDEGTPCRNLPIVEKGFFRNFYNDRYYAWKLGAEPTGNGFRPGVTSRVSPGLEHLVLKPGDKTFPELLKLMGTGVVVCGVMGAHSGNILNGDYSIGLSPGVWVENGEITGHVKDAMLAGNVYETLKHVVAVGSELHPAYWGNFPALLLDDVSFATKGQR